ncbi:hypothetical protein M758_UG200800 [Ceratodon purpureus]|nr:hypothetical protein M758_UG200800 [Ceratodon purpureus]
MFIKSVTLFLRSCTRPEEVERDSAHRQIHHSGVLQRREMETTSDWNPMSAKPAFLLPSTSSPSPYQLPFRHLPLELSIEEREKFQTQIPRGGKRGENVIIINGSDSE